MPYLAPVRPSSFSSLLRSNPITTAPLITVAGVENTPSSCSSLSADSSSAIFRSMNSIPCSESHAFSRWQKCQPGWMYKSTRRSVIDSSILRRRYFRTTFLPARVSFATNLLQGLVKGNGCLPNVCRDLSTLSLEGVKGNRVIAKLRNNAPTKCGGGETFTSPVIQNPPNEEGISFIDHVQDSQ